MTVKTRENLRDFARMCEGIAKPETEDFSSRYGPLGDRIRARLADASSEELDAILEHILTAKTLDEALSVFPLLN